VCPFNVLFLIWREEPQCLSSASAVFPLPRVSSQSLATDAEENEEEADRVEDTDGADAEEEEETSKNSSSSASLLSRCLAITYRSENTPRTSRINPSSTLGGTNSTMKITCVSERAILGCRSVAGCRYARVCWCTQPQVKRRRSPQKKNWIPTKSLLAVFFRTSRQIV
jgi:hypothetical protein